VEALDNTSTRNVELNERDLIFHSARAEEEEQVPTRPKEYDTWLLEKRVKIRNPWAVDDREGEEEEVGDSCCFGTRTVDMGMDCVWNLHGGV
jgi:hypothetical protein